MVLVLNSFIMSSLPPNNLDNILDIGDTKKPLRTIKDVKERLDLFIQLNKPAGPMKTPSETFSSPREEPVGENEMQIVKE